MFGNARSRRAVVAVLTAAVASLVVGSALAANITGTAKSDTLRGTAKADRLVGNGGNDKLYGLAGNDTLSGGAGNDLVVGGPGADKLACGPGRDTAMADAQDKPAADCETIKGLPLPSLSVSDATSNEGNVTVTPLQFSVQLAKPSPLKATVAFATRDGSASAGTDYLASNGTLTFAPGEKTKLISIAVMGDTVFEPDETFTITLSAPVNAALGTATATGTIRNEDAQRPRGGRYSGTSSQNRPVLFDVDAAGTRVMYLDFTVDLNCPGITFSGERFNGPISIPIGPDFRFSFTDLYSDADGSISMRFDGGLATSGPASGTLRIDFKINVPGGVVDCSTGDVSWTASPAG